jgi:hypothetical protein
MQGAAVKGFFIGGLVGAGLAVAASSSRRTQEAAPTKPGLDLAAYKHVYSDGGLLANLQEPVEVFAAIDTEACTDMLRAFEELAAIYQTCRMGDGRPSLVAEALKAKRTANGRLTALLKMARQRKPAAASEILRDVEALKKNLSDYIYNISQEQSLQQGLQS